MKNQFVDNFIQFKGIGYLNQKNSRYTFLRLFKGADKTVAQIIIKVKYHPYMQANVLPYKRHVYLTVYLPGRKFVSQIKSNEMYTASNRKNKTYHISRYTIMLQNFYIFMYLSISCDKVLIKCNVFGIIIFTTSFQLNLYQLL